MDIIPENMIQDQTMLRILMMRYTYDYIRAVDY